MLFYCHQREWLCAHCTAVSAAQGSGLHGRTEQVRAGARLSQICTYLCVGVVGVCVSAEVPRLNVLRWLGSDVNEERHVGGEDTANHGVEHQEESAYLACIYADGRQAAIAVGASIITMPAGRPRTPALERPANYLSSLWVVQYQSKPLGFVSKEASGFLHCWITNERLQLLQSRPAPP